VPTINPFIFESIKIEGVSFWTAAKFLIGLLLIDSSKHEVHRLLHIYAKQELRRTGLFHLVTYRIIDLNEQLAKHGEQCKFCFTVEDSKAEKLSASGAPGLRWASAPKPQLPVV